MKKPKFLNDEQYLKSLDDIQDFYCKSLIKALKKDKKVNKLKKDKILKQVHKRFNKVRRTIVALSDYNNNYDGDDMYSLSQLREYIIK
jgi:hypothetical protein